MKVLLVSEYFPPKIRGGGEVNLSLIAQALAEKKQDVSVLTSSFPDLPAYEEKDNYKIYRSIKTGSNPGQLKSNMLRRFLFPRSLIKEIKKLHQEHSFDAIHLFGLALLAAPHLHHPKMFASIESYPALCPKGDRMYQGQKECAHVCSIKKFLPCQSKSAEIGKMRNKWYLKYNPFFLYFTYSLYKKMNRALSSCHLIAISHYVQRLLSMHNQNSIVLGNIIETKAFSQEKVPSQKKSILYLGSLTAYKGPQILLEALKGLPYRCDLYGDGPLAPYLERKIKEYQLDAAIHAPVLYEQIPQLYAQADVVVFPSLWPEPFGRIPLEAQAAGKPVISFPTGAIPETVSGDALINTGNAEGLRQAIQESLTSSQIPSKKPLPEYSAHYISTRLLQAYGAP